MFPPEPPVAFLNRPERSAVRKGAPVLRGGANPCARAPFWHFPSLRRAAPTGTRCSRWRAQSLYSQSAHCASRHRFLLPWRRTRPPFAVSGEFRSHRRLSLDLPASLETQIRRPREVCLPLPVPRRRGLRPCSINSGGASIVLRSPETPTLWSASERRHRQSCCNCE